MKNLKLIFVSCCIASSITSYTQEYFVTTWNTQKGDSGSGEIVLPIIEGTYDVDVNYDGDFGDAVDMNSSQKALRL